MPIRHGGIAATRASIWPRDHFCRRTIAPRWSSPTTWNEFLPISMSMVAMVAIDLLDMAVLRLTLAPSQHHSPVGQEHGRTIPLSDVSGECFCSGCGFSALSLDERRGLRRNVACIALRLVD